MIMRLLVLAVVLAASSSLLLGDVVEALRQCGNTTTYCPDSGICCSAQYSPTKFGCKLGQKGLSWPPSPTTACCMPGPQLKPSETLPNCLIIGDSVSIGYTPTAVEDLKEICQLQHGPWDVSDGGAGATSVGVACLDNFLVTQAQESVKWDVILFNFGLHNLDNSTAAEALYKTQLVNITERLVLTGASLIYALTTPFMPDRTQGNMVVEQLNEIAKQVVAPHDIPLLDLYSVVTNHCGKVYENCDWCRRTPCSYHYNPAGMSAQGHVVASKINETLAARKHQDVYYH